jgi:hypothetical protein
VNIGRKEFVLRLEIGSAFIFSELRRILNWVLLRLETLAGALGRAEWQFRAMPATP